MIVASLAPAAYFLAFIAYAALHALHWMATALYDNHCSHLPSESQWGGRQAQEQRGGRGFGECDILVPRRADNTITYLFKHCSARHSLLQARFSFQAASTVVSTTVYGRKATPPKHHKKPCRGGRLPPPLTVETPKYKQQRNKHQTYIITVLNIMVPL